MFNAFLFDLDGTLVDSEILWVVAMKQALTDRQLPFTDAEVDDIVYGRHWRDVYTLAVQRYPGLYDSDAAMVADLRGYFLELRRTRDIHIHSSIALLKQLSQDHPVAIVSGSVRRNIDGYIEEMGIAPHLAFYLGSEDYFPGKPHPICYRMAAERLNLPPEACLVFEDSTVGVLAARDAGMHCVALWREGRPAQDFSAANEVVSDLRESTLVHAVVRQSISDNA